MEEELREEHEQRAGELFDRIDEVLKGECPVTVYMAMTSHFMFALTECVDTLEESLLLLDQILPSLRIGIEAAHRGEDPAALRMKVAH